MSISVSIVLFSNNYLAEDNEKRIILENCIRYVAREKLVKKIVLTDNSPKPFFDYLAEYSSKIIYKSYGKNLGYGKGHNKARKFSKNEKYHLILNPDIIFEDNDLLKVLYQYMENNSDISMVQPNITFPDGSNQFLCKRNPTFLAQFIRAFLPRFLFKKFNSYNNYYEMRDLAYKKDPVLSTYLSGCFMFCRRSSLDKVNWFFEKYFMYLEDADLTRSLSSVGKCVHLPNLNISHQWAKGSHKSFKLKFTAIKSFIIYSFKWGFKLY